MPKADSVHSSSPLNMCQIIEFAEFARRFAIRKPAKRESALARYGLERAEKHPRTCEIWKRRRKPFPLRAAMTACGMIAG